CTLIVNRRVCDDEEAQSPPEHRSALSPSRVHTWRRFFTAQLRERRIIHVTLRPAAIISLRMVLVERRMLAKPLWQVRICEEFAPNGVHAGRFSAKPLLRSLLIEPAADHPGSAEIPANRIEHPPRHLVRILAFFDRRDRRIHDMQISEAVRIEHLRGITE